MSRKPHTPGKAPAKSAPTSNASKASPMSPPPAANITPPPAADVAQDTPAPSQDTPESAPTPWPDAFTLPIAPLPASFRPSYPQSLTVSMNAKRRRKLHAILQALKDREATIVARRGSAEGKQIVMTFQDAVLWLVDQVELDDNSGK